MNALKIPGLVAALSLSSLFVAGQYSPQAATVDPVQRPASGVMITARFSAK